MALPPCEAARSQLPTVTNVTTKPATVQMAGVFDVMVTGRPDVDVAVNVTGDVLNGRVAGGVKVMV